MYKRQLQESNLGAVLWKASESGHKLTDFGDEMEVLLPAGASFKIMHVEQLPSRELQNIGAKHGWPKATVGTMVTLEFVDINIPKDALDIIRGYRAQELLQNRPKSARKYIYQHCEQCDLREAEICRKCCQQQCSPDSKSCLLYTSPSPRD